MIISKQSSFFCAALVCASLLNAMQNSSNDLKIIKNFDSPIRNLVVHGDYTIIDRDLDQGSSVFRINNEDSSDVIVHEIDKDGDEHSIIDLAANTHNSCKNDSYIAFCFKRTYGSSDSLIELIQMARSSGMTVISLKTLTIFNTSIAKISLSLCNKRLALGSDNGSIDIYNIETDKMENIRQTLSRSSIKLLQYNTNNTLTAANENGTICIFDSNNKEIKKISIFESIITGAISQDGSLVALPKKRKIFVLDTTKSEKESISTFSAGDFTTALTIAPNRWLVVAGLNGTIKIFNTKFQEIFSRDVNLGEDKFYDIDKVVLESQLKSIIFTCGRPLVKLDLPYQLSKKMGAVSEELQQRAKLFECQKNNQFVDLQFN